MNDTVMTKPQFDRTVEDLGNIVELGHVNVTVPDQTKATAFYLMGLGLTRDPYLMAGLENMWVNVGRGQFHLPTREPQVVRGTTGLVVPDLEALLKRLEYAKKFLEGTQVQLQAGRQRRRDDMPMGQPHPHARTRAREFRADASRHALCRVRHCRPAPICRGSRASTPRSWAASPACRRMSADRMRGPTPRQTARCIYRETDKPLPPYDGHHIQITLADFSGPHKKLVERGLITEESDQHQYRFVDIVDPDTNKPLAQIEHETRSMRHPMFNRTYVNRNPDMNNRNFVPGYEVGIWALA